MFGRMIGEGRKPVSHSVLAKACGVSQSTISRALKNDPRISAQVRNQVQKEAKRQGYRPDPEIDRLMTQMRQRRERTFIALTAFILPPPGEIIAPYTKKVMKSARSRLEELGYQVDLMPMEATKAACRQANRIIRAKTIRGALLFSRGVPLPEPGLNWDLLAPVAVSESISEFVHHVNPDYISNFQKLLHYAREHGLKRPALISTGPLDGLMRSVPRAYLEQYYRETEQGMKEPPYFFYEGEYDHKQRFTKWVKNLQPDCWLVPSPDYIDSIRSMVGDLADMPLLCYARTEKGFVGIDQQPELIGAAAADLLSAHIVRGETGLPRYVKRMTIMGRLRNAKGMK